MAASGARSGGPAKCDAKLPAFTSWFSTGCLLSCSSSCFCRTWSWVRASASSAWNFAISWECFPSWILAHERGRRITALHRREPRPPPQDGVRSMSPVLGEV